MDSSGSRGNKSASRSGAGNRKRGRPSSPQRAANNKRSPLPPPPTSTSTTARASATKTASSSGRRKEEQQSDADDESTRGTEEIHEEKETKPGTREEVPVGQPKTTVKPKDSDFQLLKGTTFTDLDEEGITNGEQRSQPMEVSPQNYNIIIPSYSAWFSYDAINAVEKRAVPEYFSGQNPSKTPEAYQTVRNFMIDSYRLNPTEYLTATSARRNLTGDVCGIVRIHAFLEQWGLINYQIDADLRPMGFGPSNTAHFNTLLDTPVGLQPLQPLKHQNLPVEDYLCKVPASGGAVKAEEDGNAPGQENGGGISSFGLKSDAYSKRPNTRGKVGREWTEQETLLLLEGLEMYKDDWNKVSEHVGSRSQDECVLHFLKLPIEDPYLEDSKDIGPLANYPIPFSKAGNPVMTTIAFLASTVDPRIASVAAQAALDKYCKLKEEVPPWLADTHRKAVGEAYDSAKRGECEMPDEKYGLSTMNVAGLAEGGSDGGEKAVGADGEVAMGDIGSETANGDQEGSEASKDWERLKKMTDKEITKKDLQVAASVALASAAVKAKNLAAVEERKIKSMVALLVETQMKKLETKLKHFEELENIIEAEREKLDLAKAQLIQERQNFHAEQVKAAEARARQQAHLQFTQQHGPIPVAAAVPPTPAQAPFHSPVLQQAAITPQMMQQQQQQIQPQSAPSTSHSEPGIIGGPSLSPQPQMMAHSQHQQYASAAMPSIDLQRQSVLQPGREASPLLHQQQPQHAQYASPIQQQQQQQPVRPVGGGLMQPSVGPVAGGQMMSQSQQPTSFQPSPSAAQYAPQQMQGQQQYPGAAPQVTYQQILPQANQQQGMPQQHQYPQPHQNQNLSGQSGQHQYAQYPPQQQQQYQAPSSQGPYPVALQQPLQHQRPMHPPQPLNQMGSYGGPPVMNQQMRPPNMAPQQQQQQHLPQQPQNPYLMQQSQGYPAQQVASQGPQYHSQQQQLPPHHYNQQGNPMDGMQHRSESRGSEE
ncbi:SWI/SNF complex subunit SMARCC1 [Hypsibius exemplaris]|uniref:SWI/SNF complex subunit SMARCC1 n=1 Tax=Hypsibius exemplaris TaxID=2072580 RepID=A0A1W0X8B7_HYPEX|nr:SWI/SNF complex subunit SMARCC1 [Hypsibius exemplaris]